MHESFERDWRILENRRSPDGRWSVRLLDANGETISPWWSYDTLAECREMFGAARHHPHLRAAAALLRRDGHPYGLLEMAYARLGVHQVHRRDQAALSTEAADIANGLPAPHHRGRQ